MTTHPVRLRTERLVLDQPRLADADEIAEYCRDPLFERYLRTPWPYEYEHAVGFVTEFVPEGWASGAERTWAIRRAGVFTGVVGVAAGGELGFWLGAPFRGAGIMPEAVHAVLDYAFACGMSVVRWEAVVGNHASLSVARRTGFRFTGIAPLSSPLRGDDRPDAWHAELRATDSREPKPGWPADPVVE